MGVPGSFKQAFAGLCVWLLVHGGAWGASLSSPATIAIPGGEHGIGFDDMVYSEALRRFIIPAGQTGSLVLISPDSGKLTVIPHVSSGTAGKTDRDKGVTSASDGLGYVFAGDRSADEVVIIDPRTNRIAARQKLAATPDYVRYVNSLRELWVTEPGAEQIQVFRVHADAAPRLEPAGEIHISGGPESLVIDDRRGVAYTNLWSNETLSIGLVGHRIVSHWSNTCTASRGLAMAPRLGLLFVGCKEGKVVSMDPADNGTILSSAATGKGVDIIAFDASTHRLYAPGAGSATVAILNVAPSGRLGPLSTGKTAAGAHCVVSDGNGTVYVCDPHHGRLLLIAPQPASAH